VRYAHGYLNADVHGCTNAAGDGTSGAAAAKFDRARSARYALIEELVGRTPPFMFGTDDYVAPRREY